MSSTDRRDLAEFAQSGSEEAFDRIARRHADMVYGVCLRRLGRAADAEDAGQAVFLALARKAGSIRAERLASWLHGAALRAAKMLARSSATRARHEEGAAKMQESSNKPAAESWDDVRPHLDAELDRLSGKLREAVIRHYLAGRSYAQLADELGVPQGTVAKRVHMGVAKLRKRLARHAPMLGTTALVTLLTGNAHVSAPTGFLTSLPQLATGSIAAGAVTGTGATIGSIAEEILKMIFMQKLKLVGAGLFLAAAAAVAVPVAVNVVVAGEKQVAPPKPAAAAVKLKPEWKSKLLVQLQRGANSPVWGPDGRQVASCLALKRERGRGYWKTTEGGVGIIDLATGKTSKVSVNKTGPVTGLLWMPGGKRLIAASGKQLWSVELAAGGLKARSLTGLPAEMYSRPGDSGLSLSPKGKYLVCRLKGQGKWPGGCRSVVLDPSSGRQLASVVSEHLTWSADERKLYFGRREKLQRLDMPGAREATLFSTRDYFKGAPPKTHAGWVWVSRPIAALKDGRIVVELVETRDPDSAAVRNNQPQPSGIVSIKGEAAVWSGAGGKHGFVKLGATKHGLDGEINYLALNRDGLLLRTESTTGFNRGKMVMQLVKADTGKVFLDIKPPRTVKHGKQDINLHLSLQTVSLESGSAVFSGSGTISKSVGRNRSVSRQQWFGLFLLEVPTGIFKRVELPLYRRPRDVSIAPGGDLLILSGRLKDKKTKDGKYVEGVWLCDPKGKEVVLTGKQ